CCPCDWRENTSSSTCDASTGRFPTTATTRSTTTAVSGIIAWALGAPADVSARVSERAAREGGGTGRMGESEAGRAVEAAEGNGGRTVESGAGRTGRAIESGAAGTGLVVSGDARGIESTDAGGTGRATLVVSCAARRVACDPPRPTSRTATAAAVPGRIIGVL